MTDVYKFVYEFEDKIEKVNNLQLKYNNEITNFLKTELMDIYQVKDFKNPYKFLTNLLINRKNYFIRQIQKVKEKILYEITLIPLKK